MISLYFWKLTPLVWDRALLPYLVQILWPTYGLHLPCCFMLLPASCVSPTSREQYQLIQSFTAFDNSLLRQYG